MIKYWISGCFYPGMPWEDFVSVDGLSPNITIAPKHIIDFAAAKLAGEGDGWFDIEIAEGTDLTMELAKQLIAKRLGTIPDNIEIEERKTSLAT